MYRLLRPLLFALPPETAHALALAALRVYGASPKGARRGFSSMDHSSAGRRSDGAVPLLGLSFANRVGLAAGLDKDATAVAGLARLGFGFLEVGTVTPEPQAGNPKPRLFRLREDAALVNRMGFNSAGMEIVAKNLAAARRHVAVPIGVNIGKNRDTPLAAVAEDYAKCLAAVHDVADYIAVNLSSPNTPGLRDLQAATQVRALIETLVAERGRLSAAKHSPPETAAGESRAGFRGGRSGGLRDRGIGSWRGGHHSREQHGDAPADVALSARGAGGRALGPAAVANGAENGAVRARLHRRRRRADRGRRRQRRGRCSRHARRWRRSRPKCIRH